MEGEVNAVEVAEDAAVVLASPQKKNKWLADLIDDRPALIEQLSVFVLTPRQETLAKALVEFKDKSLPEVLKPLDMSMTEFFEILRETRSAISNFKSTELIDAYRPQVVRAVMQGALTKKQDCIVCNGVGELKKTRKGEEKMVSCRTCNGTGEVTVQPDHERQKTALHISGVLAKQAPGVAVVVNTQNNNNSVEPSWRSSPDFRSHTDKLMYEDKAVRAIDAEFTKQISADVKDDKESIAAKLFTQRLPSDLAAKLSTEDSSKESSGENKGLNSARDNKNTAGTVVSADVGNPEGTKVVFEGKPLGRRPGR